jgi:dTDP-3-amino-3,4,6-trideoxy-alpha-D-glucose transaminase
MIYINALPDTDRANHLRTSRVHRAPTVRFVSLKWAEWPIGPSVTCVGPTMEITRTDAKEGLHVDGVPFAALDREHAQLVDELRAAFDRVVGHSAFILGEEVERFEAQWASACGTAHCVGTASGTSALTLLLSAAGIGTGDEVIVPAHTFIATALAIVHAGAVPVVCDVEPGTGLLDVDAAAAAVGPRTAAIVPVHLYGQLCDMGALTRVAARHGLALIEDAAQAHGAEFEGRRAGGFGAGAAYSFYPSKNLGALGDAGAICTDDGTLAESARRLRNLGQRAKGEHVAVGVNERLDGLQAALLQVKLPRLEAANAQRRAHAARYRDALAGQVEVLQERPATPCVYHLFPVRVRRRDAVANRLRRAGIQVGVHYAPALHRQPALRGIAVAGGDLAEAEAWAAEELSLPMAPGLRAAEIERAAAACAAAVEEADAAVSFGSNDRHG